MNRKSKLPIVEVARFIGKKSSSGMMTTVVLDAPPRDERALLMLVRLEDHPDDIEPEVEESEFEEVIYFDTDGNECNFAGLTFE